MRRTALSVGIVVLALAAGTALASPAAGASAGDAGTQETSCASVPCGYIYPLIIIEPKEDQDVRPLPENGSTTVDATLTWTFDITQEGFTVNNPTEPIVVTFEFPRKPAWAGMEVKPKKFEVPISPQYIQPVADDPANPSAEYVYTKDITLTISQTGQPTLAPGEEHAELLLFAKSSESGLYKPSYGIKELAVDPQGPVVHESSAEAEVQAPSPGEAELPETTRALGPVDVTFSSEGPFTPFQPAQVHAAVAGPDGNAVPSYVSLSLVNETGSLVYASGPRHVRDGSLSANLTVPEPGSYRVLATARPAEGADVTWTPGTVAAEVTVPPTDAEAVQLPNQYSARYHEVVSEFHAEPGDPAGQYEKVIPLPVYPGANSASLLFNLATDNPVRSATPTGPANLNVELRGPNGGIVAKGTFDPANPTLRMPVSALPGPGQYSIHVFGQGADAKALAGAAYDVQATVSYDGGPVVDDVHDGTLGAPGTNAHAGLAVATEHEHLDPWTSQQVTVDIQRDGGGSPSEVEAALTVLDAQGHRVHSTGWTTVTDGTLEANVTFPSVGRFLGAVHVRTPPGNGTHVQPTTLATLFHVGGHDARTWTYPTKYQAAYGETTPADPDGTYRHAYAVPVRQGAQALAATLKVQGGPGDSYQVSIQGPDGGSAAQASGSSGTVEASLSSGLSPGRYTVTVRARTPDGGAYDLSVDATYPQAPTGENPLFARTEGAASAAGEDGGGPLPAPGPGLAGLAAATLAGAALAARRRR